jgi:hypothetical protein
MAISDHSRIDEMLMEMVDILDNPVIGRASHAQVVEYRQVLHVLA